MGDKVSIKAIEEEKNLFLQNSRHTASRVMQRQLQSPCVTNQEGGSPYLNVYAKTPPYLKVTYSFFFAVTPPLISPKPKNYQ